MYNSIVGDGVLDVPPIPGFAETETRDAQGGVPYIL